jgi:predicted ATP-dependent endonuclease of OLD family
MRIEAIELANFRKLKAVRVELSDQTTVLVGANNSGKTSAMLALRYFLVERERGCFSFNDFTLSHRPKIDEMGRAWEAAKMDDQPPPHPELGAGSTIFGRLA